MRKRLHSMKYLMTVLLMVLVTVMTNAQKTATTDGDWDNPAIWSPAGVPAAGDDVTINNGIDVTVTDDRTCASVTFRSASGSLTVNSGIVLTVSGQFILELSNTANTAATLTGAGTLNCGTFQVGGVGTAPTNDRTATLTSSLAVINVNGTLTVRSEDNGGNQGNASMDVQSGVITVAGSVIVDSDSDGGSEPIATLDLNAGGAETATLALAGDTPISTPGAGNIDIDFNGTANTVSYSGANQAIYATTYRNLTITGSGTKTIQSDMTINGNLLIIVGTTLSAPAGGSDDLTIGGNWENHGTFSGGDDVVTFNGSSQTIGGTATTTFNNLSIGSSTATTLEINTLVAGNLTVTTGDVFNLSTFSCNRTAAGGTMTITGTLRLAGDAGGQAGSNFPTNFTTNTMTGGRVIYEGSNAISQTVYNGVTYENLELTNGSGSGTADKVSAGNFAVNGTFTINADVVFTPGATDVITGTTNTITGSGTIKVTRITATPDFASQYVFSTDNLDALTVDYAGNGDQTINLETYGSILTSGSGTKTLGGAVTANVNVTVGTGTILNTNSGSGFDINLSGGTITINGTLDFSNTNSSVNATGTSSLTMGADGLIRTLDPTGLGPVANASLVQSSGTFTTSSIDVNGTVEYYAAGAQTVTDRNYNNLIFSGAGTNTWTFGANRTVNGNLTMEGTSPLTLAGGDAILLLGDWIDNSTGAFTQGSTLISFNGTAEQTLGGSQPSTFINVTINNSSATGLVLNQEMTITGIMTLTDGIVYSGFPNIVIINDGATTPGASDVSFVQGAINKVGNDAYTFPVGEQSAGYHPISISAPGSVTDVFGCSYNRASAWAQGGITAPGLLGVSGCEYWYLSRNAGGSTPDVTLSWNTNSGCGGTYINNLPGLQVAIFDGGSWSTYGRTSTTGDATAGTITWDAVSTWPGAQSYFAFGNTAANANPLPVKFSDIKAYEKQSGVQIDWTAYQEVDMDHYQVERSADGIHFAPIGSVASRNSLNETKYGYFDASPLPGVSFYRLKNVDLDGKTGLSNIVKVNLDKSVKDISLYPNPVRNGYVSFQSADMAKGQYMVRIFNAAGQQVMTRSIHHTGGSINQTIQLPVGVKSGMYSMLIELDGLKVTAKTFIVQ